MNDDMTPDQVARMERAAPIMFDAIKLTKTIFETAQLGKISREAHAFEATLEKIISQIEGDRLEH